MSRSAGEASRTLNSVELFAGAGGLALGLANAGFSHALVVDSDQPSIATLQANADGRTKGWRIECADVRDLHYSELGLPAVDLLSAGAPCQPFSVGGRLRGEDDDRNMFPEVVRAVRELRPRAFVFENVRGLLFERVRPYFDYILAQLGTPSRTRKPRERWTSHGKALQRIPVEEREYVVTWRLLNAADFGLAQNRPRLVVVGMRAGERQFGWPPPTHNRPALVSALHGDDYWEHHRVPKQFRATIRQNLPKPATDDPVEGARWQTLRDLTARLGEPHGPQGVDPLHRFVPGARLYKKHTGSKLDWPAKTVKAGVHGCPGGEHIVVADDGSYRYLTVRECAELQGLPADYVLPHLRRPTMRQLGNAVPVALAEAVGRNLHRALAA
jgi:DNA (cytosine-5)-methyltransferase 1